MQKQIEISKRQEPAVLNYKEFEGRNHFVLGKASWKENASSLVS
jgi:hypothetical protein